jgi:hypothetical protein
MAGAMILWMTFSFSGISRFVLGGKPRSPEALYGENTPWHLTEHLRANPPTGQIYNPQWWGDWLAWDGPQGLKVFATTNLHLMPWQVWADHQRIGMVEAGWDAALDRYSINTVVVDKKYQPSLARFMRRMPEWTVQYEDEQGLVCVRQRKPKPTTTEATPLAAHRND